MPAVLIAAANLLAPLQERLAGENDILTFIDTEPIQALQAILDHRPSLIVLERLFAATPRGAALINRIKNDPQLDDAEIRVLSHSGDYMRQITRPRTAAIAVAGAEDAGAASAGEAEREPYVAWPLDSHGTRRAPRERMREGVELLLDGNPARVVAMSTLGAEVLSLTILRPNQKVRVSLGGEDAVLRFRGGIVWATFELPPPPDPPQYRAGVEFFDANAPAIEEFCQRNRT